MIVFYSEDINETGAVISGDEHKHCTKVLRHNIGDIIHLVDGNGIKASGILSEINKNESLISITNFKQIDAPSYPL